MIYSKSQIQIMAEALAERDLKLYKFRKKIKASREKIANESKIKKAVI